MKKIAMSPIYATGKQNNAVANKSISIKYISSTIDEKNINLKFIVVQANLSKFNAKVFVQEMKATNEVAVNQIVSLKNVKEQSITVSFDKNKEFDKYIW